jgi:flagellar motor switch protein FliM
MIATEIQIGENTSGMMNIGVPSSIVKLLRQKFDQQWSPRRATTTDEEGSRMLDRIKGAAMRVDARMEGSTISFADVLQLTPGDVLMLDASASDLVTVRVNGLPKFKAGVTVVGRKKAVQIEAHA